MVSKGRVDQHAVFFLLPRTPHPITKEEFPMKNKLLLLGTIVLVCLMCSATVLAEELAAVMPAANMFIGTFWSLVPPLVAIVLAILDYLKVLK